MFEKADTDGSGAIDYEEFAVAASNTSFLRTGLQLLSVQEKLQREEAAVEAEERAVAEAAAAAEAARGRWCLCVNLHEQAALVRQRKLDRKIKHLPGGSKRQWQESCT